MLQTYNDLVLMHRMEVELKEESPTSAMMKPGATSQMCWVIHLLLTENCGRGYFSKN